MSIYGKSQKINQSKNVNPYETGNVKKVESEREKQKNKIDNELEAVKKRLKDIELKKSYENKGRLTRTESKTKKEK